MSIQTKDIHPDGLDPSVIRGLVADPWRRKIYVSSAHPYATDNRNGGGNFRSPLKTLKWWAEHSPQDGDLVLISGMHQEEILVANGINIPSTLTDVAIVGLGQGNRRPQFLCGGVVGADFMISGAGTLLKNLRFSPSIDSLTAFINCNAAECVFEDLRVSHDATNQALAAIVLGTLSNRNTIRRLRSLQIAAGAASCIQVTGTSELLIEDCNIEGDYSVGNISNLTTACTSVRISRNFMENLNAADPCIALQAAATGWIGYNAFSNTQADAADTVITAGTGVSLVENYVVNADRETGKLVGTVSG